MDTERRGPPTRLSGCGMSVIYLSLLYVLSSGPVLAIAFRLREATGWDGFYGAMLVYYPLLALGHDSPMMAYIEWWVVDVFHTVGPG